MRESRPSAPTSRRLRSVVSLPPRSRRTTPLTASPSRSTRSAVMPSISSTPGAAAAVSRISGSNSSRRRLTPRGSPSGVTIQPQRVQARKPERTAPRSIILSSSCEPLERRDGGGLDEVRAHPLEGARVGQLVDQRDARARATELDRRSAAGDAGADDHRVVVRRSRDDGLVVVACRHVGLLSRFPADSTIGTIRTEP